MPLVEPPRELVSRIAADRSSGAAQIAADAARAVESLSAEEIAQAIELLLSSHPSMAPLWRLATEVLSATDPRKGAARFLAQLAADATAPAILAPRLPDTVATISYSSSVLETVRLAGRRTRWICMTSEPGGEGRRMAEAARLWSDARVVLDEEALELASVRAVVMGADAVTPEGVVNKVKTRALVGAARSKDVPCYAVAGETKFIAEPIPLDPAFELTPLEWFTGLATPKGLLQPEEARRSARAAKVHDSLRPLLDRLSRHT